MIETCGGLLWGSISAILNCLMLPLMIVAIFSAIMGASGGPVGAILADGIQTISAFAFEIGLRLFRTALACLVILARALVRGLILAYGLCTAKK